MPRQQILFIVRQVATEYPVGSNFHADERSDEALNDSASQIINHLQFIFDYLSKLLTYTTAEQKAQIELIYFIISLPFSLAFSPVSSIDSMSCTNDDLMIWFPGLYLFTILYAPVFYFISKAEATTQAIASGEHLKSVRKNWNEYFKTINSSSAPLSFSILEEITLFQWLVLWEDFQVFPWAMIETYSHLLLVELKKESLIGQSIMKLETIKVWSLKTPQRLSRYQYRSKFKNYRNSPPKINKPLNRL